MKRLLVCLLLVGVVGCSSDADKAIEEYNKGVRFTNREDWATAITHFNEAIRLDPDFPEAYNNRGIAHRDQDDKAIADFTEAIRLRPDYANAYSNRSRAYGAKGDKAKAEADFAKAKELGYKP